MIFFYRCAKSNGYLQLSDEKATVTCHISNSRLRTGHEIDMIDGFKGILLCRCLLVPYSQVRLLISPFSRLRGASSKFRLFDLELQFQAKASQLQFQVKAGQFQAKAI